MPDYFKLYCDWIDWSIYEGLSLEEQDEIEAENEKIYGVNHVLKPGAPPEAVEAWKKDCEQTRKAREEGIIIN